MAAFRNTLWRWISGILGVMCLLLMATLGVMLNNLLNKPNIEPTISPGTTTQFQEDSCTFHRQPFERLPCVMTFVPEDSEYSGCYSGNYSGYRSCPERWVGYQCNCYFISSVFKTWEESRDSCYNHSSTLLQLHTRDELNFMKYSLGFYWIGVTYSEKENTWVWEDNSTVSKELLSVSQTTNSKNCVLYNPLSGAFEESCSTQNLYICKQQMV